MSINMLKLDETNLLKEVLLRHQPSRMTMLDSIGIVPLTNDQREELREVIADELLETGLDKNDEPNERGLLLEHLIDRLGHL